MFRCAFSGQNFLSIVSNYQRFAPTNEVERNLVYFFIRRDVRLPVFDNRPIKRIFDAGLINAVEIRVEENLFRISTVSVDMLYESNLVLRERSRLVGAEHRHAAEVLYGREIFHDGVFLRHSDRPSRERHGEHDRQEFRRQPDCDCDGKRDRLDKIAPQHRIHEQHEPDQYEIDPHHEETESADIPFEIGFAS